MLLRSKAIKKPDKTKKEIRKLLKKKFEEVGGDRNKKKETHAIAKQYAKDEEINRTGKQVTRIMTGLVGQ